MEKISDSQSREIGSIHFKFYRHATFQLNFDGKKSILVDPMYARKGTFLPIPSVLPWRRNPLENFPAEFPEIGKEDILLITHHHFDHFDQMAAKNLPKSITIISPANGLKRLQKLGFQNSMSIVLGQTQKVKEFNILAVPVKHTQRLDKFLYKPGVGYLVQGLGKNIYISGDTVYFKELMITLKEYKIDLAILYGGGAKIPFVGRHTFSHQEIIVLIEKLNPRKAVVIHLDALNHCREARKNLKIIIEKLNLQDKIAAPIPGEEIIYHSSK